jgi:hypothetical protein
LNREPAFDCGGERSARPGLSSFNNVYIHLTIWLSEIDEAGRWLDTIEQLNPEDSNLDGYSAESEAVIEPRV